MEYIVRLFLATAAVIITAYLLPGVHLEGFVSALAAAVVLGFVNTFIRPLLLILTLPINVLTLGLFTFVVIALCVQLVSAVVPGFHVQGLLWALAFALVLALVNTGLERVMFKPAAPALS